MSQASEGAESPSPSSPSVDELVGRLRKRVEERRANGEYPDDLEERLDAHFRRIVFHRVKAETDDLNRALAKLDQSMDFTPPEIAAESGIPGGELVHRVVNKAISRHQQATYERMAELAEVMRETLRAVAAAVKDPNSHTHPDIVGRLDAVIERLDSYERDKGSSTD